MQHHPSAEETVSQLLFGHEEPPVEVEGFTLRRRVGEGGMGVVYEA